MMENQVNMIADLVVATDKGVADLRKLGISPAEIRAVGFTIDQMRIHLGVFRLIEAGFTLRDFQSANFSLQEIRGSFPLEDLVNSDVKYSLEDLLRSFSPAQLKSTGKFKAIDFLRLGMISARELRVNGFSNEEIEASLAELPRPIITLHPRQPPNAQDMKIGDKWENSWEYLHVVYSRLPPSEATSYISRFQSSSSPSSSSTYGYDGSGKHCPRCGRLFVLIEISAGANDMRADESGVWVCDDSNCGMKKEERYNGYGSIFS